MDLDETNELDLESFSGLEAMFGLQKVDASEGEAEAPAEDVQDQGSPAIKHVGGFFQLPARTPPPSQLACDSPLTLASSPPPPPAPHDSPRPETQPRRKDQCRAAPCKKLKKGKSAFCEEHRCEWEHALKDAAAQDEEFGDNAKVVELQQLSDEEVGEM